MAQLFESGDGQYIAPEQWATDLIVEPVKTSSIASLVSTVISRSGRLMRLFAVRSA